MDNINSAGRKSFFPNSKINDTRKSWATKNTSLNRNTQAKMNQLNNLTSNDAKVSISDAVRDFSRIKKAVDMAPEIDNRDKIAKLKAQIANGSYKINYDDLADKIIASEF